MVLIGFFSAYGYDEDKGKVGGNEEFSVIAVTAATGAGIFRD